MICEITAVANAPRSFSICADICCIWADVEIEITKRALYPLGASISNGAFMITLVYSGDGTLETTTWKLLDREVSKLILWNRTLPHRHSRIYLESLSCCEIRTRTADSILPWAEEASVSFILHVNEWDLHDTPCGQREVCKEVCCKPAPHQCMRPNRIKHRLCVVTRPIIECLRNCKETKKEVKAR